ncbi:hypothetical protein ACP275_03G005000 [Erythranthe tilingii]
MASSMLRRSIFRNLICARPTLGRRISSSSEHAAAAPWLLIEDSVEDGVLYNNFYSMSDKKIIKKEAKYTKSSTKDIGMVVGSSHGWLALCNSGGSSFNNNNNNMYLYNPVSQSIFDLPSFPMSVPSKVILSSSPEEDSCRAIMSFGPQNRLLYCCPGRSNEWTPIDDEAETSTPYPTIYNDFVYSKGQKLLFSINSSDMFECWDLADLANPKQIWKIRCGVSWSTWRYLVFAEQSERLFLVDRYVVENIRPYGATRDGPHQTFSFYVIELIVNLTANDEDDEDDKLKLIGMATLDGMAFFVGSTGHGVVIEETVENNVEPNSIYFTDTKELTPPPWDHDKRYGGHDVGVFNYEEKNFSPFYYSHDIRNFRRINNPAPTWFSPSH